MGTARLYRLFPWRKRRLPRFGNWAPALTNKVTLMVPVALGSENYQELMTSVVGPPDGCTSQMAEIG